MCECKCGSRLNLSDSDWTIPVDAHFLDAIIAGSGGCRIGSGECFEVSTCVVRRSTSSRAMGLLFVGCRMHNSHDGRVQQGQRGEQVT